MRSAFILALALPAAWGQGALDFLVHNRPIVDCHNCYPTGGAWADRVDRALKAGFPVAIEQDLAFYDGRVVVSHSDKPTGGEPQLRDYFFEHVRPIVEQSIARGERSRWPLIVLHFDFKSDEPALLHAVWSLLGEYQDWITTAVKTAEPGELAPFDIRPLLVLTEDSDAQEQVFYRDVPQSAKLRVFGSAHTNPIEAPSKQERSRLLATLPPEKLLSARPTDYRRWWNNSWAVVEEGGPPKAGAWTPAKEARLRALVNHAHKLGYWIRFYTLDGFTQAEDRGWDQSYNFGSRAAMPRWEAALRAGVNLIATDQMEALAEAAARQK
jgi:hypothetical protein